jgi:hypothetical protein
MATASLLIEQALERVPVKKNEIMKTILLDNIISQKELFFMYNQIISNPSWTLEGQSTLQNSFNRGPILHVKNENEIPTNYAFFLWGQTLTFRIAEMLEQKNIGIPTTMFRMWFNATYHGKKTQHWLHVDGRDVETKSIVLFMTPVWQPDWRGSFYVDGEEFKYKPGGAVIFDSSQYHQGESPESETYNWQRLTCNITVRSDKIAIRKEPLE